MTIGGQAYQYVFHRPKLQRGCDKHWNAKTPPLWPNDQNDGAICGGSYRDRTDDIHGVNVALYQLS